MLLRHFLEAQPETISDMSLAVEQKFWEGIELCVAGRHGAGIYLLGYAAEMYLKIASFRLDGANPADFVAPRLARARNLLRTHPFQIAHEHYHSLLFWLASVRALRQRRGTRFERNFEGELVHRVRRLYGVWWVEMRYHPNYASVYDVNRMFQDVGWLRRHLVRLWR
jgi:hypothetical protein